MKMLRQGDVLLVLLDAAAARKVREGAKVAQVSETVLAEGEVTGHAHRLEGRLERFENAGRMFVTVEEDELGGPGWLRHEEHADFPVPVGTYEVRRQREYTEVEDRASWMRVAD